MRVFVTGATRALGRHLVPGLVAAGHEVTATTRTPGKVAQLREAGAEPVILDGLDREAVIAAVRAASPEVVVHQMTALADMRSLRNPDKAFAATNELRTLGTDNLLAAAARAGTRRVIAQGYAGAGPDKRSGGRLKTEEDPLDWRPIRSREEPMSDLQAIADRVEIEALRGEFTDAAMMRDRARLASLFTHDGALRMPNIPAELVGREEIRAGGERLQGQWDFFVQTTHPGTIQLNGDTATGRAYIQELARARDGRQGLNYVIYHDRYRRTPDGWKFTERVYEVRYLDTSPLAGSAPSHHSV